MNDSGKQNEQDAKEIGRQCGGCSAKLGATLLPVFWDGDNLVVECPNCRYIQYLAAAVSMKALRDFDQYMEVETLAAAVKDACKKAAVSEDHNGG